VADLPGLSEAIEAGDRDGAVQLTAAAIAEGVTIQAILDAMTDAMDAVGEDFQANLIFVPEMLVAARAMREAMGAIVAALRKIDLGGARMIVGGAPVNAEFAARIGADAYAGDAGAAATSSRRSTR
jgi:methanogenic corrinoid protein MtbC1